MKIQLIRHGTIIIYVNNKKLLVDPMLSPAGTMSPIPDVPNTSSNPLVELPLEVNEILNCDAVLVTHTHRDHFDETAINLLPKYIPLFCQPRDKEKIQSMGFRKVHSINSKYTWEGITLHRTCGRHGHGVIALKMAPVSGFVIKAPDEPSVYVMGDTVLYTKIIKAMEKYSPDIAVCNSGSAQFSHGKPITMSAEDIFNLCRSYPSVKFIAVHLEAWNHCRLSRKELKNYLDEKNIKNNILIPDNGETISL